MSLQQRWDVALKVLNGPLASAGEQVIRGPVVRIGADPGPGGLKLGGYRGLDARQCVITAYDAGTASVAPVGTNQVRLAPHSNVSWADIDPIVGPEYLTPNCALHLGPVGRGATIEFVACRRLGEWKTGVLASERVDSPANGRSGAPGGIPEAYDVRRVGRISASLAPFWFLGCSFLMATTTAGLIGVIGVWQYTDRYIATIGPINEGYEFYDSVQIPDKGVDMALLHGLEQPYYKFVMEPNIAAAHAESKGWEEPEKWDQAFVRYMTASVEAHALSWAFFSRLEAVRVEYAKVVISMRRAGLPEVFAAIPYQESRYNASIQSEVCAEGFWQFMPETAYRIGTKNGLPFRVADCRFRASTGVTWSPSELAPPPNVFKNGAYMDNGTCMIERCNVDDRKDLDRSTAAAAFSLKEAWDDPLFAGSGADVQLTITSHNSGYDDGRFGEKYAKGINVKPAYKAFVAKNGAEQGMNFVGANIRCRTSTERERCDAAYMAETQHYAYTIVAQHILAVCYYAKNYGEDPAFNPWTFFVGSEGYCKKFDVPTKETVRARRSSGGRPGGPT